MRLNFKGQFIGAAAIFGTLLFTACSQEDQVSPLNNQPLEERGFISGTAISTPLIGLTETNELVNLMSGPPVVDLGTIPITGLRTEEVIRAIDTRPLTKELYGVSNQNAIYKIDKSTGAALIVSPGAFTPEINGEFVAFDFNPTDDVIRLITNTGQNLRISPVTGTVIAVDVPINSFTVGFNGAAYSTSVPGIKSILYDIDPATGALYKQSNPNTGAITYVGLTGFNFQGEGGFEITNLNVGFTVQFGRSRFPTGAPGAITSPDDTTQDAYRLLAINLRNGVATSHGKVRPMIGLTIN